MKIYNRKKIWTEEQLIEAVKTSTSVRQVAKKIGLRPAGGNYEQIKKYIKHLNLNNDHFKGMGWSRGLKGIGQPRFTLEEILTKGSHFQSFKLKKRLFKAGLKQQKCELCGWHKKSIDGRIPLELDHMNGDRYDNRIENLRILCPNCHALQPTHRGLNKKKIK